MAKKITKIIVGIIGILMFIGLIYLQFNPILNDWQMLIFGAGYLVTLFILLILVQDDDEKDKMSNLQVQDNV